jgi:hypothetical protein
MNPPTFPATFVAVSHTLFNQSVNLVIYLIAINIKDITIIPNNLQTNIRNKNINIKKISHEK